MTNKARDLIERVVNGEKSEDVIKEAKDDGEDVGGGLRLFINADKAYRYADKHGLWVGYSGGKYPDFFVGTLDALKKDKRHFDTLEPGNPKDREKMYGRTHR